MKRRAYNKRVRTRLGDEDNFIDPNVDFDPLLLWEPVRPKTAPLYSSPEIRFQPIGRSAMSCYNAHQLFGDTHVEILSWLEQIPFTVLPNHRVGYVVDYHRLELVLDVECPITPTFEGDTLTVAVFWDRNYPPATSVPPVTRYFEPAPTSSAIRNLNTEADCELLWTKDYVMEEPRYDAVGNPVRPNSTTRWTTRVALDLEGLRGEFAGPVFYIGSIGPGALTLVTKCARGGLPILTMNIRAQWLLYFENGNQSTLEGSF